MKININDITKYKIDIIEVDYPKIYYWVTDAWIDNKKLDDDEIEYLNENLMTEFQMKFGNEIFADYESSEIDKVMNYENK